MRPHDLRRGRHQGSEDRWEAMRALSSRPFCSYDSRRVSLGYLSAGLRYTTQKGDQHELREKQLGDHGKTRVVKIFEPTVPRRRYTTCTQVTPRQGA